MTAEFWIAIGQIIIIDIDCRRSAPGMDWRQAARLRRLRTATPTSRAAQMTETPRRGGRDHLLMIEPSGTDVTGRLRGVVTLAQAEKLVRALPLVASRMS
jgi:hypothetical protein